MFDIEFEVRGRLVVDASGEDEASEFALESLDCLKIPSVEGYTCESEVISCSRMAE